MNCLRHGSGARPQKNDLTVKKPRYHLIAGFFRCALNHCQERFSISIKHLVIEFLQILHAVLQGYNVHVASSDLTLQIFDLH